MLASWARTALPQPAILVIVGERWSSRLVELRDLAARNSIACEFLAHDSAEGQRLLHEMEHTGRLPAVIFRNQVLSDPKNAEIAEMLGGHIEPEGGLYDLVIVGAGPAGLAAAVYGASDGLRTLVVESKAPGGQAGTTSMIRNYLGFPRGISGAELASRAQEQAISLGAEFVITREVTGLALDRDEWSVALAGGSAVVGVGGQRRLEAVEVRDKVKETSERMRAGALFVLVGAGPHTAWLPKMVQRDPQGYVLTGPNVIRDARGEPPWRLGRAPFPLETSLPGVFAAGDVRHRATRRVSAAVADGAIAVRSIWDYLNQESP